MYAKCGDQFEILGRMAAVRSVTVSSVCLEWGEERVDVHYPCVGPYRVVIHLMTARRRYPRGEANMLRMSLFRALGIPESESWEIHLGGAPLHSIQSDHRTQVQLIAPTAMPTPGRRLLGLFGGLCYLMLIASPLSAVLSIPYWAVLDLLFCGTIFVGGVSLWGLTLWALRKDSRLGQFSIGFLLFLTTFVALYLGTIRSLQVFLPYRSIQGWSLASLALVGLVPIVVGTPFLLPLLDALLWGILWLLKAARTVRRSYERETLRQDVKPQGGIGDGQ